MQHLWLCIFTHQIKQTEYEKTTLEQEEHYSKQQWVQPWALEKQHSLLDVCNPIQSIKPLTTNTALWLMDGEKIKTESSSIQVSEFKHVNRNDSMKMPLQILHKDKEASWVYDVWIKNDLKFHKAVTKKHFDSLIILKHMVSS